MPKFRKATRTTIARVLRAMAEQADDDPDFAETYAEEINPILDDLLSQDYFGTEGQIDPRGDHRD